MLHAVATYVLLVSNCKKLVSAMGTVGCIDRICHLIELNLREYVLIGGLVEQRSMDISNENTTGLVNKRFVGLRTVMIHTGNCSDTVDKSISQLRIAKKKIVDKVKD